MSERLMLRCDPSELETCCQKLIGALQQGAWVQLQAAAVEQPLIPEALLPEGPGVVIASGGTSGGRKHCLQPSRHLDQSAEATAEWLLRQGLSPTQSLVLNPLPLHHVSGLMPWWRSRCWGAEHVFLTSHLMRDPEALALWFQSCPGLGDRPVLLSLVPTQLKRLLDQPQGVYCLQRCAVIWIGGSPLSEPMAERARRAGLRLAPCYGSSETAAMVTALPPEQFLAGVTGSGSPLSDVQLRLGEAGAIQVKTPRLALGCWTDQCSETLVDLQDPHGWWESGDLGELMPAESPAGLGLRVLGRRDGAIHCGGETVFPEQLELRLLDQASGAHLALAAVLFLAVEDEEWGQRLVALVRPRCGEDEAGLLKGLKQCCAEWIAAERPAQWIVCPDLLATDSGKWERHYWRDWLINRQHDCQHSLGGKAGI